MVTFKVSPTRSIHLGSGLAAVAFAVMLILQRPGDDELSWVAGWVLLVILAVLDLFG